MWYNNHRGENGGPEFDKVYRSVWDQVFAPSLKVRELIDASLNKIAIIPGEYVAAHVRSLYLHNTTTSPEYRNALECAAQLLPGKTIFFASDSQEVTRRAIEYGKGRVVADVNRTDPLHLDRGSSFLKAKQDSRPRPASDYYSTFVDLYMMKNARCVTYGRGG